jgi:hypothetical protein
LRKYGLGREGISLKVRFREKERREERPEREIKRF